MIRLMVLKNHRNPDDCEYRVVCRIDENKSIGEVITTFEERLRKDIDDQLGCEIDVFNGLRPDRVRDHFFVEFDSETEFTHEELLSIKRLIEKELRSEHKDTPIGELYSLMKLFNKICSEINSVIEKSEMVKSGIANLYDNRSERK